MESLIIVPGLLLAKIVPIDMLRQILFIIKIFNPGNHLIFSH